MAKRNVPQVPEEVPERKLKLRSIAGKSKAIEWKEVGQTVAGKLLQIRKVSTENGEQHIFSVLTSKGPVDFWESFILEKLRGIPIGTYVEVEYLGLNREGKTVRSRKTKLFDIRIPENLELDYGTPIG